MNSPDQQGREIQQLFDQLPKPRALAIMEVCGTHTVAIARSGLRKFLPAGLRLISGPGCPVCVTDQSYMDQAVWLARGGSFTGMGEISPAPIIATYGDMVRVPGRHGNFAKARSEGAAIEVVYSAHQAVELARANLARQVVFLGVGFETTTPGTALAVLEAQELGLENFSVLAAHKLIVPAMRALLSGQEVAVDGFLCPGHVSVILGYEAYDSIVRDFGRPCVVAGFDPAQILAAVAEILRQRISGQLHACTVYPSVSREGNLEAMNVIDRAFKPGTAAWRAIGDIPGSGMVMRDSMRQFNAFHRFDIPASPSYEMPGCRCGAVLCGKSHPTQCPLFANACTPRDPIGPCMVSSEGACAAAYKYERNPRKNLSATGGNEPGA
jgi:hydrogenase expression/formation protein HypD